MKNKSTTIKGKATLKPRVRWTVNPTTKIVPDTHKKKIRDAKAKAAMSYD